MLALQQKCQNTEEIQKSSLSQKWQTFLIKWFIMPHCCSKFFLGFICCKTKLTELCHPPNPHRLVAPVKVRYTEWRLCHLNLGSHRLNPSITGPPIWPHFIILHHCFQPRGCVHYIWREKRLCFPSRAPCVSQTGHERVGECSGSFMGSCLFQWTHLCPGDFSLLLIPYFFATLATHKYHLQLYDMKGSLYAVHRGKLSNELVRLWDPHAEAEDLHAVTWS